MAMAPSLAVVLTRSTNHGSEVSGSCGPRAAIPDAADLVSEPSGRDLLDNGRLTLAASEAWIATVPTRISNETAPIWDHPPEYDVVAATRVLEGSRSPRAPRGCSVDLVDLVGDRVGVHHVCTTREGQTGSATVTSGQSNLWRDLRRNAKALISEFALRTFAT